MKVSKEWIEQLMMFEGLSLVAYPDPATKNDPVKKGEPITIGFGTTIYPNGQKVRMGDRITKEQAILYKQHDLGKFEKVVLSFVKRPLTQNQFDALVSLSYNIGPANFAKSTLVKKVNINPKDPTIQAEFMKWTKANGKIMNGLVKRRNAEWNWYSK